MRSLNSSNEKTLSFAFLGTRGVEKSMDYLGAPQQKDDGMPNLSRPYCGFELSLAVSGFQP